MNHRLLLEGAMLIRNDPRFKEFRDWLTSNHAEALTVLAGGREANLLHRAQGAYGAYGDVLNLIETAPAQLEKLAR